MLVKGPFITLAHDFATGTALSDLVDAGVGHKELLKLKWEFGNQLLFKHQESALRRVYVMNRSAIVKTGTAAEKLRRSFCRSFRAWQTRALKA